MKRFKAFPFIDKLQCFKEKGLSVTAQLFIISLIAYYHESQRSKGKIINKNITQKKAIYKIIISDKDIIRKFGFCIETILNIRKEIEKKDLPLNIQFIEIVSESRKYKRYQHFAWGNKYLNEEYKYSSDIITEGKNIVNIPTKVIYAKKKDLSYSEKLAIIWNFSLQEKLDRKPKLKEIAKSSGISERTVGKAIRKYCQLFECDIKK